MPSLAKDLRSQLSRTTLAAREAAEKACRAALENLAVHEKDYRGHMTVEQRQLRNRLRARGRALGDVLDERSGRQEIRRLAEDAAYEHWHRLLFTRFLAENGLLHTDAENGSVPVTLEDCEELAPELGAKDGFDLACRFAQQVLPGVFRTDDPVFELVLALNDQVELRSLIDTLPREVFTADDSLGWTYQFWQAKRKDEVNKSGAKIGADEISPVTQLFTEDYMVEFLLHNTLGAWWMGKFGPIQAESEEEARAKAALPPRDGIGVTWTYLRFVQDEATKMWKPAAGTFDGWPKEAKSVTFLDPCMGSGHFPVYALSILARLRMEEEKLSAKDGIQAVLRDNIHGLELDPRCCQIGAFNLALTAWKLGGYQPLPPLHIACCGLAPQAKKDDWLQLAEDNDRLRRGMARLYDLFEQAPVLGSLINPRAGGAGDLLEASFDDLSPLLEDALADEKADDATHEIAVTAQGVAKAAEILAGQFTLVVTNVPYLGRPKQSDALKSYCEIAHPDAKADLATCLVERSIKFCGETGSIALVTPQNWLFLGRYSGFRRRMIEESEWNAVARLGPKSFQTPMWDFNIVLLVVSGGLPRSCGKFVGIDVGALTRPEEKADSLISDQILSVPQMVQLENPDGRISLSPFGKIELLNATANAWQGIAPTDVERFRNVFWEQPANLEGWEYFQSSFSTSQPFAGREHILFWEDGYGAMEEICQDQGTFRGRSAWGKKGVMVSAMAHLPVCLYSGERFDPNAHAVVPFNAADLPAIWAYAQTDEFAENVRELDQKVAVTNSTIAKIPFDLAHWQKVAAEKYPLGLPEPHSDDPTQWLFNGHPKGSDQPLHVAVARLLSYRWPRQTGSRFPDCPTLDPDGLESFADEDGIVCLPALNREQPAAARLRNLLAAALGSFDEKSLLAAAGKKGSKATRLEDWLRDEFFDQHCELFHQRPFVWHVWDGRKDGFAALVNYHKLDHGTLQKLTYTYLGNWIHDQERDAKADKPGAAERLGAAQALQAELAKILEGEAPYDLFVRWKPLSKQAIGWHPDLNDGVRLNIRPFLQAKDLGKKGAGILRGKPNIKWDKDRGKEPERPKADYPWFWCAEEPGTDPAGGKDFTGNRWNDVHLTLNLKKSSRP